MHHVSDPARHAQLMGMGTLVTPRMDMERRATELLATIVQGTAMATTTTTAQVVEMLLAMAMAKVRALVKVMAIARSMAMLQTLLRLFLLA